MRFTEFFSGEKSLYLLSITITVVGETTEPLKRSQVWCVFPTALYCGRKVTPV